MMKQAKFLIVVFTFLILGQGQSQDILSNTTGFKLSLFGSMDSWDSNSFFIGDIASDDSSGNGFGFDLAYGTNSSIEVFISYSRAKFAGSPDWDIYRTESIDVGGRYFFGASLQRWRPYAQAAIGTTSLKLEPVFIQEGGMTLYDDAEMVLRGLAFGVGAGVNYFITPEFSLGLNVSGRMGNYSNVKVNGNEYDPGDTVDFRFLSFRLTASYIFY